MDRIDRASALEAKLIRALFVLYDKDSIADPDARDQAYLAAMRALNKAYPDDSDIAALYAASYMSIGRWDYWDSNGNPRAETIAGSRSVGTHYGQRPIEPRRTAPTCPPNRGLNGA